MAKIDVVAKSAGQKPDRTWAAEGETFSVPEELFSPRWMRKVEEKPAAAPKRGRPPKGEGANAAE